MSPLAVPTIDLPLTAIVPSFLQSKEASPAVMATVSAATERAFAFILQFFATVRSQSDATVAEKFF